MSKRTKLRLGIVLLLLAAGVVAYIVLSRWMSTGSTGTVQVGTSKAQTGSTSQPVPIDTPYLTTRLPAGFSEKRRTETPGSGGTLLQLFAIGGTNRQQDVAITVGTIPADGLSSVADYNLRRSQPALYTSFVPPNLPGQAVAFRTVQGAPGFVVFWPSGSRYFELSFSSSDSTPLAQLQATYLQAIGSWQAK